MYQFCGDSHCILSQTLSNLVFPLHQWKKRAWILMLKWARFND